MNMHDDRQSFNRAGSEITLEIHQSSAGASNDSRPTLSVIGLGKLGSPMAACFSAKGFRVIGVDNDPQIVSTIDAGKAPVYEPNLEKTIQRGLANLSATLDLRTAVIDSRVTFVIVPTPSEEDGSFSLRYVLPVCEAIGSALREKETPHLVCLCSTVMPGATGGAIRETLEKSSGRIVGEDLGLCYSPEFIALGSVIRDFLNPDFLLIGESDEASGDLLESIYRQALENEPTFARMNFVNAEISKIAVNSFVTTKITYANMIAGICQRTVRADVDVVTQAVGLDSRIGRKYLKGAVGFGGPCFPRDNVALARAAQLAGAQADLARSVDTSNLLEVNRLAQQVTNALDDLSTRKGGDAVRTVGILGLSYKPDTDVVEQSQGIMLAQALVRKGYAVAVFDPAAMVNAKIGLGEMVHYCESLEACAQLAEVLVIVTAWDEFRNLPTVLSAAAECLPTSERVLIDCWRMLDRKAIEAVQNVEYRPLGIGPTGEITASENTNGTLKPVLVGSSDSAGI